VSEEVKGKDRIIRQADLAGTLGVEVGRNAGFGGEQTSRRHARVKWDGKVFVLCDLDSLNGTKINGREIKGLGDQPLAVGDQIAFGARDALYRVEQL
jgi:pSer/pThr/pTyr-binding forkhead associated (FHA) protein